jgi:hypothetical protein
VSTRDDVLDLERWSSFHLSDEQVLELTGDSAVVAYRAAAVRDGTEYSAMCSSTYVRNGGG